MIIYVHSGKLIAFILTLGSNIGSKVLIRTGNPFVERVDAMEKAL